MSLFALVGSGVVVEIAPAEFPVNSAFAWVDVSAMSPTPAVGWTYADNVFTAPPAPPAPTLSEQAAAALGAGVQIISTGTPALNGTYATDSAAQLQINSIWNYVIKFNTFPGGAATYMWADISGAAHTFPSVTEFEAFAAAICVYVSALTQIALGLSTSALPSSTVTIA